MHCARATSEGLTVPMEDRDLPWVARFLPRGRFGRSQPSLGPDGLAGRTVEPALPRPPKRRCWLSQSAQGRCGVGCSGDAGGETCHGSAIVQDENCAALAEGCGALARYSRQVEAGGSSGRGRPRPTRHTFELPLPHTTHHNEGRGSFLPALASFRQYTTKSSSCSVETSTGCASVDSADGREVGRVGPSPEPHVPGDYRSNGVTASRDPRHGGGGGGGEFGGRGPR